MAVFSYTGNNNSLSSGELEERGVFSYNTSSIIFFESEDYGLIGEFVSYYDDFGLITDSITSEKQIFNYGSITILRQNIPFGKLSISTEFADVSLARRSVGGLSFLVSGKAKILVLPIHIGSGRIRADGSAGQSRLAHQIGTGKLFGFSSSTYTISNAPSESKNRTIVFSGGAFHAFSRGNYSATGQFSTFTGAGFSRIIITKAETNIFRFTGSAVEKNTESYVGSGSLFGFVGHAERVTYDYNESSVVRPEGIDYGFISDTPTNITNSNIIFDYQNEPISTYANEIVSQFGIDNLEDDYGIIIEDPNPQKPWNKVNYGFITDNDTRLPFGGLKLASLTTVVQSPSIFGSAEISVSGVVRIFVLPIHVGSGVFNISGNSEPKAALSHIGSGRIFGFTGSAESLGANPPESTELFKINGSANQAFAPAPHIGSGQFSAFTGSAYSRIIITKAETNLFAFSGSAIEKNAESYVGSGSLFGFVGHAERVTYDYNESSVVNIDSLDYGFISDTPTNITNSNIIFDYQNEPISTYANEIVSQFGIDNLEDDYGIIIEDPNPQKPWNKVNYGFITEIDNRFPFGKLKLESSTQVVQSPSIFGTPTLELTGTARIFVLPIHIGSGNIVFGGDAGISAALSHIGSGRIFGFTGSAESLGANPPESTELFKINGSANQAFAPAPHIGSGQFSAFTGAAEARAIIPSATGLFKFIGAASEKNTESYVGSGSLFGFVGHAEKVTYDYNESSVVNLESLDYGFITETPINISGSNSIFDYQNEPISTYANEIVSQFGIDNLDDYGYITQPTNYGQQKRNYGYITDVENRFPFGRFRFSDDTAAIKASLSHIGSGRIFAFTGSSETILSAQETTGLFKFLGTSQIKASLSHVGSGSIFAIIGGQESITQESHIGSGKLIISGALVERNTESYAGSGKVTVSSTLISEYRSFGYNGTGNLQISRISSATIGFGLVHVGSGSIFAIVGGQESITQEPHIGSGKITISGAAVERNTESYAGSGHIFAFTGASETKSNAQSTTGLFKFFGSSPQSITPAPHIGSGRIFAFTGSAESTSSTFTATGLFKFTGAAVERNTESYAGSGHIFTFASATVISSNAQSTTGLFKFFGSAIETNTESYVGSGRIFGFTGGSESKAIVPSATGLFKFTGAAVERNTESYAGSGSLFAFTGSTVVFAGAGLVEGPLFKINGSATFKFAPSEVGQGIFNLRQKVSGLDVLDKQRYISGIERKTVVPKIDGALFRATGVVTLFFIYGEVGSGTIKLAGNARTQTKPVHVGQGQLSINGSAETPRTRPYIGTGSLFGFNSATNSTVSRPPISGTLFRFTGAVVEKNTEAYVGSTSTKLSGSANIIARLKHIGSGKTTIFGSAIEKNTESYVGSGRIFGFTGGSESIGRKLPEFKTLFKFIGAASEKNTESYVGSGSLFGFVSKTESTSSAETKTTLFKFSGSAVESNTESYIGSGLVRFRTKDSILDINGKVIFVSAQESFVVVPPTKTSLFKFGGAAKTERNTNWTSTGTLFGFGGGAERVSFTPAISTTLFDFVGNAQERKSKSYTGSGTIFAFTGASESAAVVSTTGGLFRITGSAKESVLPATYVGSGSLFGFVSKTESVTFSPPTTNLFKFTGSAVEKNTEAYLGTGRIFGFQSAGIARVVPYDRTQILFRLSGASKERFEHAGYVGITQVQFNGISTNRYVEFDSPKPIRIYII